MLPGTWFYETGLNDENSSVSGGVFSGGSGFSSSGSGPASTGAPGDCSPLPNGVVDYGNTNFDDEFSLHLLRTTDNTLSGSRNVTESVEVPSSEHVAEIVGRQGCKIKALRAKTNTYIKTPVRGEEPVFVVTGRREDVVEAKKEIECAAEHFTQIRASRRHSQGGAPAPGHVTAYVRVPLRVVGLVVGPKGGTIKRIQQDTHTYIITPSREREPIFEVTGLPQNVDAARKEIEQHIYQRTGNMPITDQSQSIVNFDLAAAAQLAAQAATVNAKRPDYGALAAVLPNQQHRENMAALQFVDNHQTQQQQQQNSWSFLDQRDPIRTMSMCNNDNMFNSISLNSNKKNCPTASDNYFFGNLDSISNTTYQSQHLLKQYNNNNNNNLNENLQLLLSDSNSQLTSDNLFNNKSYQTWSDGLTLGIGSDFSNFTNDLFSSAASVSSSNPAVNNLKNNRLEFFENISINNGSNSCGLFSTNSTSRDEGLGDSPTNTKGSSDPFHLMISSLWSNVDSAGPTPRDKLDTAKTSQQLASI